MVSNEILKDKPVKNSILVVDDDRHVTRMLRRNLEDGHLKVMEAGTGVEALNTILNGGVGLILMDIGLPDFSGWGILCLLRMTRSMADIPVIIMSADPPDRTLLNRYRPNDYIQKPFDMRDLLTRTERYLGPVKLSLRAE